MYKLFQDLPIAKTFLQFDRVGQPARGQLRLAVAVLLWQMAHIDGKLEKAEYRRMIQLLDNEFHLVDQESADLLKIAEKLEQNSTEMEELFREVTRHFDEQQRGHLFDMVWEVARSDGKIEGFERVFAAYLRYKLNLSESYGGEEGG